MLSCSWFIHRICFSSTTGWQQRIMRSVRFALASRAPFSFRYSGKSNFPLGSLQLCLLWLRRWQCLFKITINVRRRWNKFFFAWDPNVRIAFVVCTEPGVLSGYALRIFKWPHYHLSSFWNRTIMVNAPFLLKKKEKKTRISEHILHTRIAPNM